MDRQTILALRQLNRRFYREQADSFDRTRTASWWSWEALVAPLSANLAPGWRGLDAGCGNGRFASFLNDHLAAPSSYLGLDFSLPLLLSARRRLGGAPFRWLLADLADPVLALEGCAFDLVSAMAVLHHLPSAGLRTAVVARLVDQIRPGGLLLLSFWDFAGRPEHRRLGPSSELPSELDPQGLEPGGALLPWGRDRRAVRYCHLASAAERRALVVDLPLDELVTLPVRGRPGADTTYQLFRRRSQR